MTNILQFPLSTYTPEEPFMTEEEEILESASRQLSDTANQVMSLMDIESTLLSKVGFASGTISANASGWLALMIKCLTKKLAELERI